MRPMVSVWMITYNHGKFIAQAIESVIAQKTNFDVEIIIGEDCSQDDTREIIQKYESKYPHLIHGIYHEKNVGASRNAYEYTLPKCKGKYIACLEGDDYWTDTNKLQKQVDFLEANSDFSACGHQATVFFDDDSAEPYKFGGDIDKVFTRENMIGDRKFHTSALLFRGDIIQKTGGVPLTVVSGDRAIFAMLSIFGKIMYFKESMCTYRKSTVGISNRLNSKDLEKDLNMVSWIKNIDPSFPVLRLKSFVHFCIYTYPLKLTFAHLFKHYFLFVWFSFSYFPKNLGDARWGTVFFFRRFKELLKNRYSNN